MANIRFTSKQYTKTRQTYRKSGQRRWKLVATESPCEVDVKFIANFLLVKPPGRETQSMDGDTIVITTYILDEPEKIVTRFAPIYSE